MCSAASSSRAGGEAAARHAGRTAAPVAARTNAGFPGAPSVARGLAMLNGHSPVTRRNRRSEKAGRPKAGLGEWRFFCFSCHAIGSLKPAQVFDAQDQLAKVGDRLLPEYFRRWMSSPLRVDPQTKMPAYYPQGRARCSIFWTAMRGSRLRRCVTSGWAARWCRRRHRERFLLKNPRVLPMVVLERVKWIRFTPAGLPFELV